MTNAVVNTKALVVTSQDQILEKLEYSEVKSGTSASCCLACSRQLHRFLQ